MIRKIGGGAVAEVFLARSDANQQQVVMKILRPELLSDTAAVGRFLDEAKVCETLNHPNVVQHLGVNRTPGGGLYILTRYVEGVDLSHHLHEKGPLSPQQWLKLARPLCAALEYIHQRGIIHRDLKPSNVFLAGGLEAYRPILIDFGVARFEGRRVKTELGMVLTTPEYNAPELIQGGTPDVRSDLYALGILMFESLVGHPPFSDPSPTRLLRMHLEEQAGPLPTQAAALEPVLQRCLAKKPEERFQSALEFAAALEEAREFLSEDTQPPAGGPAPAWQQPPTNVAAGDTLGSYKLDRVIGEGGMGRVFLATHQRLGKQVAIKVLLPELSGRRDVVERFFHEARTINQINHEHIVEVHDFVDDRGRDGVPLAYCVMELLGGKTLREALTQGPISLPRVVLIGKQLCDALGAAHRLGIVHRDVKPENVFLTERSGMQDFVRVLDFGMAKFLTPIDGTKGAATLQGMIIGTPDYMAPEQANGGATDVRTDIYALGVLLYEMLAGRVPFSAPAVMALLLKIGTEPAPPLPTTNGLGEPIPESLARGVMQCLEKSPSRRPATVQDILAFLEPPTPAEGPPPQATPPARRPSRMRWVAVGVAVALGVGLPAGLLAMRGWSRERALSAEIALADARMQQMRLAGPGGDAALDHLLAAQKMVSGDARVRQRLLALADLFEQLGDRALQRGDRAEAAAHFQAALLAAPSRDTVVRKLHNLEEGMRNTPQRQTGGSP